MTDLGNTYHIPGQPQCYCPACQEDLSLVIRERGPERSPEAGDQTVCGHCLTMLKYVEPEPGELRLDVISREEFEGMAEQHQAALMQVQGKMNELKRQVGSAQPSRFEAILAVEITKLKRRVTALEASACACCYCSSGDGLNCNYKRRA